MNCFWCNIDPEEAAKHHEGPHLTWCPYFSLQTRRLNSPSPASSAAEERSASRSSDHPYIDPRLYEHIALMKRFYDLVSGANEFHALVREIKR